MATWILSRPATHQGECDQCGWHTRESDSEKWVQRMNDAHDKSCPNPFYRYGAAMACGCWTFHVSSGEACGEHNYECPMHGRTTTIKMNITEPTPYVPGCGNWKSWPEASGGPTPEPAVE